MVREVTDAYDQYLTVNVLRAFEAFVDDLSNWYIRRSRRRFWDGDEAALRTLYSSLVDGLRAVSPIMPFLTEHLWQVLVDRRRARRAALGVPRRLARGASRRRRPARGDRRGATARGARPPGPGRVEDADPPAAAPPGGRGPRPRRGPSGRDRRRAPGQGGHLRTGRGHRAAGAPEPAGARPAPRCRAREAAQGARGRRVRGAARRRLPRRRPRPHRRRGARGAHREGGLGGGGRRRRHRGARPRASTTPCASRAASTT